jgi:hypothetical protein
MAELFAVAGLAAISGALFTSSAISSIAGPPLVGLLIDHTGSAIWPPAFACASGALAFVVLVPLRRSESGAYTVSDPARHIEASESRSAPGTRLSAARCFSYI